MPSPDVFSDDPVETAAARAVARDEEERIGFGDDAGVDADDDHIAIDPEGYHDEFTDNDSDVFEDGDGDEVDETYSLHRRVDSK
jgi:hypothetical protein